eukprot:CAMPEP_0202444328 /NCGR_PEP_ID=MMETSP1360-20130828/3449_1 /ASSEMBLY_ACC=CAM_ASM_000848 /TAXON_ID=515479 /ORGANISM="Licmophora paradoxa, Strain CCMP2313" /LENGTH=468 /DNA_ID=CAMNT_0049060301 /DNA_START=227 /DNA_END=1633 /DNA_ORIENTATION=-
MSSSDNTDSNISTDDGRAEFAALAYSRSLNKAEQHSDLNIFTSIDKSIDVTLLPKGRLSGMTIALKDSIHSTGLPNTAGTPALKNFIPTEDAPAIKRLKDEGAIIFGKTNMHELAFGITSNNAHFGAVRNPHDRSRFSGGSSGGSAAAVAARIVQAAIAGDTGGSIRIPSALCGAIGFRPSPGRYPDEGITPISLTRDVIGPVSLNMSDITLLDSVLAARPEITKPANLTDLRLGVARDPYYIDLNPEIATAMDAALGTLRSKGVTIVEMCLPEISELVKKSAMAIALYETVTDIPAYLEKYQTGVDFFELAEKTASPDVHDLFSMLSKDENGNGQPDGIIPKEVYDEAMTVHRPALIELYKNYFEAQKVDAIVFPTTILPAGPIEGSVKTVEHNGQQLPTFETYIRNTEPSTIAGLPGITLPIGLTEAGLPLAIELDAAAGNDDHLLAIALAVEPLFDKLPAPILET